MSGVPGAPTGTPDPLVIRSLEFLGPQATAGGWRPDSTLPEVAFAGRSNVGKSSLLNALVRRKAFARVSRTPGRTREINFFAVNGTFVLADLPGYGYARIAKSRQAEWRPLIEGYLRHAPTLRGVVLLLDVRRDPTDEDQVMLELLTETGIPTLICVTKVDKVGRDVVAARMKAIAEAIGFAPEDLIPFSAIDGRGRDDLAAAIGQLVAEAPVAEAPVAEAPVAEGSADSAAAGEGQRDSAASLDGEGAAAP